jgi:hypothetical protein
MSDVSSSVFQVWTARIHINSIGIKKISSEVPVNNVLHQNYPNPFNPNTRIKFQVQSMGNVKIVVYDIAGREIANPVNQQLNPGAYEVDFDGNELASGIYYYKLITEISSRAERW